MFVNGMMHLIEQGIVKRQVYDNLLLQQGINDGKITQRVDERLFDYGRLSGLIPRRTGCASPAGVTVLGHSCSQCVPPW